MCEVIDFRTRKKWAGSRTRRPPAKVPGASGTHRVDQGGTWQQIGEIAAPIIGGLRTR